MGSTEHQRQIIDTFVNSVYVFDDRVVLNFNFTDDAKTISREEVLGSSAVDNAPPYSLYPNPILYEKGFGYFLFHKMFSMPRVRRTVNEQRQDIIMAMVSCLLCYKDILGAIAAHKAP